MKYRLLIISTLILMVAASSVWAIGAFPKVGEYEVLRGDFHMHTVNSDGKYTTRQRIEDQKKRGIDALAITDHGNARAVRFEMQYAPTLDMVAVRGMETGLPGGLKHHMVALGFDPLYSPKNPHNWSPAPDGKTAYYQDEMIKLRDSGGLLVLAHPRKDSLTEPSLWGIKQGIIQGVEVHNGKSYIPHAFDWALEHNLAIFANSDAHSAPAWNYTLVFVKEKSSNGVMDAIRARRTIALYEGVFWGRHDMLTSLVNAMVKVLLEADNGANYVVIENTGPVAMKGTITGTSELPLEIAQNSKARVPWTDAKTITIHWNNMFISSKENLTSTFSVEGD